MGQVSAGPVCDETLHTNSIITFFKTFVRKNPEVCTEMLHKRIYEACMTIVHFANAFIELAFEVCGIEVLTAYEVRQYTRYIGDRRLIQLVLRRIFDKS